MSSAPQEIRIAGGGLAGLALGIALRERSVPVRVIEAGVYPRHKVCGEFIAGLPPDCLETLGIADLLADAKRHREVSWFQGGRAFRRDVLPTPALGISRYQLDQRLARRFVERGGILRVAERLPETESTRPGTVWAAGRRRGEPAWVGIKAHCVGLKLNADLELHLGDGAYVGASAVEDGRVNVCGLFRIRPGSVASRRLPLLSYLDTCGLAALAQRVRGSSVDEASCSAVAALAFGIAAREASELRIGDAFALVPAFTGDGMAMAFESAEAAVDPIQRYASGAISWDETRALVDGRLRGRFRRRLSVARALHPFLFRRGPQALFQGASRLRLLPFRPLFGLLHA